MATFTVAKLICSDGNGYHRVRGITIEGSGRQTYRFITQVLESEPKGAIARQTWNPSHGGPDKLLRLGVIACLGRARWVLSGSGSRLYRPPVPVPIAHPHANPHQTW